MKNMTAYEVVAALIVAASVLLASFVLGRGLYPPQSEIQVDAFPIAVPDAADAAVAVAEPTGPEPIVPLLASADVAAGESVARACAACHSFDKGGRNGVGPNIWNKIGNDIASKEGFNYSDALAGLEGVWTYEALDAYLYAPADYAPGNRMAYRGVKDTQDRANLIAWMRTLSDTPAPLPGQDGASLQGAGAADSVDEAAEAAVE